MLILRDVFIDFKNITVNINGQKSNEILILSENMAIFELFESENLIWELISDIFSQ